MDRELARQALEDWRTAPIPPRLRGALGFLEAVTLWPDSVSSADAAASGVEPEALREALMVGFAFNVLNRCSDAFDFGTPTPAQARRIGLAIHLLGYRASQLPG
jgi:alkylhydroperoxidase family enzyme